MTQPNGSQNSKTGTSLLADTATCVRFLSRLRLPKLSQGDDPERIPDFRSMARAIPLAGLVIGLPAAILCLAANYTDLPRLAVAALVVGLLASVTGALHEDGLSDVFDGFFGGATIERRLDIMKDSRIGAFGAVGLCLSLIVKVALVAEVARRFGLPATAAIVLVHEALTRLLMLWQWSRLPSARPGGLGNRFGTPEDEALYEAAIFGVIFLALLAIVTPWHSVLLGAVAAIVVAWSVGRIAISKIGGFTGDVLGAIQQTSGLGFLIGLTLFA